MIILAIRAAVLDQGRAPSHTAAVTEAATEAVTEVADEARLGSSSTEIYPF